MIKYRKIGSTFFALYTWLASVRVFDNDRIKVFMNISGQEATYDVMHVSFFPWYCNILKYGFQKFKQILNNFHSLNFLEGCTLHICENTLNTSLAAKGALAHRLQRCTACNTCNTCNTTLPAKSKMADSGPENGWRGLERWLPLGFWVF